MDSPLLLTANNFSNAILDKAEVEGPHQTSLAGLIVRVAPAVLLQTHVALAVVLAAPVVVAEGAVREVG